MGRAIKINITLPEEELSLVDVFVQKQGDTRSGLIQQALRAFMEQKEREAREREKREGMIKAALEIKQLKEKSGQWDGVAEIRRWRETR